MTALLCAVDVGTGSARAGILDPAGRLLGRHSHPIEMTQPAPMRAEHSSEDIWAAVGKAVAGALAAAGTPPERISGLAFDATCSLVVRGRDGAPLAVSQNGDDRFDTIAWLDHRAMAEAADCTASGDPFLRHIGGAMSPEMQTPKLMWLKRRRPDLWPRIGHLFDLGDFLAWKATGNTSRSVCTLTTKWAYLAQDDPGWQYGFLERMGVADARAAGGLPESGLPVGADLGPLSATAARELGLPGEVRVAAGMIDAFAGGLGVLGPHAAEGRLSDLALVAGTSSCVMAMSASPTFIDGYWGPYAGPTLAGLWTLEGGQSATGALLDHIVRAHRAGGEPTAEQHRRIAGRVSELRKEDGPDLAGGLHVLPDFHGNRTPFGDPSATGAISGLTLDSSFDGLCRLYWRTCVAIALGVKQILDGFETAGHARGRLLLAGGHVHNPLLMELYPDIAGRQLCWHAEDDAMLLGTAMAASVAAGVHASLADACRAMARPMLTREPDPERTAAYARDEQVFLAMQRHRGEIARLP